MKRVLIISPRFPPRNAPDHHRVRLSLPYYREFGWEPTVLCVSPQTSDGVDDPLLEQSLPDDITVVRVDAWAEETSRRFGFGHLDYRCLWPLYRAGTRLLEKERFDVVFFSTTVFLSFLLGPLWKRRFGCKLVYDMQDPWSHGDEVIYNRANVPGSWWKFRLGQALARHGERFSLRRADHVLSVSPGYVTTLSARYPELPPGKFTVSPFGVSRKDFEFVEARKVQHELFSSGDGCVHWVYAGRVGPDMHEVLNVFFREVQRLRDEQPQLARRLRILFVGTNYSPTHRTYKVVEPLAKKFGLGDLVFERSERVPYFKVLSLYRDSDAVLLIGSDSADYTASKLFNCVLSGRPVLAMFHAESLVSRLVQGFPNVFLASFRDAAQEPGFGDSLRQGMRWLQEADFDGGTIEAQLDPWSAREGARIQSGIFDKVLAP